MKPELISFDAAGTLIDVHWQPGRFAVECALLAGVVLDAQVAQETYERLLQTRWRQYCALHIPPNENACDSFWEELTRDWLLKIDGPAELGGEVMRIARVRLYGPDQVEFRLFADVLPLLDFLKARGQRMIVLSNWDYSLHRVLRNLGIAEFFEDVVASLEHGPEKPDPALFEIVCRRVGLPAGAILHVGDHVVDDLQGARNAGLQAIFLDRDRSESKPQVISSLCDLPKALEWLD